MIGKRGLGSAHLLAIACFVYLMLAIATAATRQPYGDEGELASPGYTLVHRGYMAVTTWEEYRDSRKAYWTPPVFFLAQAALQSIVGFGVIQLRLVSVLSGLALLLSLYYVIKNVAVDLNREDAQNLALACVALLGVDYTFLMHAGVGRTEMLAAALALAGIATYIRLRQRSLRAAVLAAHTLMAASALTHPVGTALWIPALLGLQVWFDWRALRRWTTPLWMALPYLLGAGAWGLYILQDPAQFNAQFFRVSMSANRLGGLSAPFSAILREVQDRFLGYYGIRSDASASRVVLVKLILPIGYCAGLITAIVVARIRRRPVITAALALFVAQFFILALLEGTKQYHYLLHVTPVLTTLLAASLWFAWKERMLTGRLVGAIALGLAILQIGPVLYRVREDRYHRHFLPVAEALRPHVQSGKLLVGEPEFAIAFGFPDNVIGDPAYGYRRTRRADFVVADRINFEKNKDSFRSYKPDQAHYMDKRIHEEYDLILERGNYMLYRRRTSAGD